MSVEEVEALRLKDVEGFDQEKSSVRMNVSRPTFQRVLSSARKKVSGALLNGKAIRIEGGTFRYEPSSSVNISEKDKGNMKIAVVTDDGKTVCKHFGHARYYSIFTIKDGKITGTEQREKAGHSSVHGSPVNIEPGRNRSHGNHAGCHGVNAAASHNNMMANITDCKLVIAGGMGWGAHESLKQAGIDAIITDVNDIDEAVAQYLNGTLTDRKDRLH